MLELLAQTQAPGSVAGGDALLQVLVGSFLLLNLVLAGFVFFGDRGRSATARFAPRFFLYQFLIGGAFIMIIPFYWMVVTAFKDAETAATFPPVWTPSRIRVEAPKPGAEEEMIAVRVLTAPRQTGDPATVAPESAMAFREVPSEAGRLVRELPEEGSTFQADPATFTKSREINLNLDNFRSAWHRPEEATKGQVNFFTYFLVSVVTSGIATIGTLITSAFAAFAFARLTFYGKEVLFYLVLATMMVPGQVLLIPNFLILSKLGLLDTYTALIIPWVASVFTIFLMRQFFMTIPEDLWDAARIDGASRFRYLWQVVAPLSKPVFITAGIFDFLNNWNSLLWPLIVTSTPTKRTLMVGLQNLNDDAGAEFHVLMAASCFAIFPVVLAFFFLQRFFIEGIARTGLK